MSFDYYASLPSKQVNCPKNITEHDLASGFVDECTVWLCSEKEKARNCYMKRAGELKLTSLPEIDKCFKKMNPDFEAFPDPSWLGIKVKFVLETPWYSKDDRPFHVLDNPVRKDRVFGVPFMSAASWKGMLRWACRMQAGLLEHLEKHDNTLKEWKDPDWILHLFGNEREEDTDFSRGALLFYPTWFDRIGFEVINPHERKTKAGKNPIYYEVVPAETTGKLHLLYSPLPGQKKKVNPAQFKDKLAEAIIDLLEKYGISAKRTVGWGTARITNKDEFKLKIQAWCTGKGDKS